MYISFVFIYSLTIPSLFLIASFWNIWTQLNEIQKGILTMEDFSITYFCTSMLHFLIILETHIISREIVLQLYGGLLFLVFLTIIGKVIYIYTKGEIKFTILLSFLSFPLLLIIVAVVYVLTVNNDFFVVSLCKGFESLFVFGPITLAIKATRTKRMKGIPLMLNILLLVFSVYTLLPWIYRVVDYYNDNLMFYGLASFTIGLFSNVSQIVLRNFINENPNVIDDAEKAINNTNTLPLMNN